MNEFDRMFKADLREQGIGVSRKKHHYKGVRARPRQHPRSAYYRKGLKVSDTVVNRGYAGSKRFSNYAVRGLEYRVSKFEDDLEKKRLEKEKAQEAEREKYLKAKAEKQKQTDKILLQKAKEEEAYQKQKAKKEKEFRAKKSFIEAQEHAQKQKRVYVGFKPFKDDFENDYGGL